MSDTRPIASRESIRANLVDLLNKVNWAAFESDTDLAVALTSSGVRHPDYAGSLGTVPALRSDLFDIGAEVSGPRTLERHAWHLTKRGWFVDDSGECDPVVPLTLDDFGSKEERGEQAELLRSAFIDARVDYLKKPGYDWLGLPYALVSLGVTHPNFSGPQVDPTGALDREIEEMINGMGGSLREFGESTWACFLADRGWVVDKGQESTSRSTILGSLTWTADSRAGIGMPDWLGALIVDGIQHPAYLGSGSTARALGEDLKRSVGQSLSQTARDLEARGWYMDPGADRAILKPVDRLSDEGAVTQRASDLYATYLLAQRSSEHHYSGDLIDVLVAEGVTHPDFADYGVDPTSALARESIELLAQGLWASTMAERGWLVDRTKGEQA